MERLEKRLVVLDYETEAIENGGPLLPKPVGCAVLDPLVWPEGHYYAFGHDAHLTVEGEEDENNCSWEEFGEYLESIWHCEILTQNGATFDLPISQHWFNLPDRDPKLTHDTLFASYLHNPHARSLSLKDLADDWLGIPPDEQQAMYDWLIRHGFCNTKSQAGAFIARAPVRLVGPYAVGDCTRTLALWNYVSPLIADMPEAYEREIVLGPILSEIRNVGVRCDVRRLATDYLAALHKLDKLAALIRHRLNEPTLNISSDAELGAALVKNGFSRFLKTEKTGKNSMGKASLEQALSEDPELQKMIKSHATYSTLTGTFMWPWLEYARKNKGRIHAAYNQVRNPDGFGTRTGRLSSSGPNFQNVPNEFQDNDYWDEPYPIMRSYLLPEEGHEWTCGDFKNQEPRLAAHFEDGEFMAAFNENPLLDPYLFLCDVAGMPHSQRKPAKIIYLGLLYAMGAALLAEKMGTSLMEATNLRNLIKASIPDIVALDQRCKRRFQTGMPIKTLGGRFYFCEPPSGNRRWDYKALNTLIQGSAADQTKEAIIYQYYELRKRCPGARILGTVHDEISVSHLPEQREEVVKIMQESANALKCDVKMLMDIFTGDRWSNAEEKK